MRRRRAVHHVCANPGTQRSARGGSVEQWDIDRERIEFGLPGSLKKVMRDRGVNPVGRRIVLDRAGDLEELLQERGIEHQTIDLTIGRSG